MLIFFTFCAGSGASRPAPYQEDVPSELSQFVTYPSGKTSGTTKVAPSIEMPEAEDWVFRITGSLIYSV
jgi:hypothetical protein